MLMIVYTHVCYTYTYIYIYIYICVYVYIYTYTCTHSNMLHILYYDIMLYCMIDMRTSRRSSPGGC